jgi:hypothetical protein
MKGAWTIHAAQRPFPVLSRIGSPRFSFKWTASFMCPFSYLLARLAPSAFSSRTRQSRSYSYTSIANKWIKEKFLVRSKPWAVADKERKSFWRRPKVVEGLVIYLFVYQLTERRIAHIVAVHMYTLSCVTLLHLFFLSDVICAPLLVVFVSFRALHMNTWLAGWSSPRWRDFIFSLFFPNPLKQPTAQGGRRYIKLAWNYWPAVSELSRDFPSCRSSARRKEITDRVRTGLYPYV